MGKKTFLSDSGLGAFCVFCCVIFSLFGSTLAQASARDLAAESIEWLDTPRDVYIDGNLERGVEAYLAEEPDRLALAGGSLPEILVIDLESLEIATLPRSGFEPTREGARSSLVPTFSPGHKVTRVVDRSSSHYLLEHRLQTILVSPHQGLAGPLAIDDLWRAVPAWKRRLELAEPVPEAVADLGRHGRETKITVVLGTWCGDSRKQVPPLLAALRAADNPKLQVEVVSILRGFEQPAAWIRDHQIINVPTILVEEEGREIGRVIETPALETVEEDVAAILAGRPVAHQGRYARGIEVARGRYLYRNGEGKDLGSEEWTLFLGEEEGRLLWSEITTELGATEIFHRRESNGSTRSLEITRRSGGTLSRTRAWESDGEVTVNTRGDTTGIVRQVVSLPDGGNLRAPGVAEAAFDAWAGVSSGGGFAASLRLGPAGSPLGGEMARVAWEALGEETISTPAGDTRALHFRGRGVSDNGEWWVHPSTGVTLKARLGAMEVILEELVDSRP